MKVIEGCLASLDGKRGQILVNEGLIVAVGDLGEKAQEIYGDDTLIFPAMGDVHVHAREDASGKHTYKEDFYSASNAALNGGVHFFFDMPNNPIAPIDKKTYEEKFALSLKARAYIGLYAGIGPNTRPLPYRVPYKVYMGPSVGDLFFTNNEELEETLQHYSGEHVSFHCEDPELLESSKNEKTHYLRRPRKAEVLATDTALYLIEKYNLKGKLCHYSVGEGLRKILKKREEGVDVEVEVTPQHLYFNQEDVEKNGYFQMNPPIRSEEDRSFLWEKFLEGHINYLATDHAPHTLEEKTQGMSGLTGLDTYGGFLTWAYQQGASWSLLSQVSAENPGKFLEKFRPNFQNLNPKFENWGKGLGKLDVGYKAQFTLLKYPFPWEVTHGDLMTKVQHSPFLGITLPGRVRKVIF